MCNSYSYYMTDLNVDLKKTFSNKDSEKAYKECFEKGNTNIKSLIKNTEKVDLETQSLLKK